MIVTAGTLPTAAAKRATATIPIVMYQLADPVGSGLVASLARPGGNVTGLGIIGPELHVKMLQLLKQAVPDASRIAVLYSPTMPVHAIYRREIQARRERDECHNGRLRI